MKNDKVQTYFFLGLLALSFGLAFLIFKPYLGLLMLAGTLAVVFEPLFQKFIKVVKNRKSFAALLTTLTVLVIILGPLTYLSFQIFKEARSLYVELLTSNAESQTMVGVVQRNLQKFLPKTYLDLNSFVKQILTWIVQNIGGIFSSITQFFLNIMLSLVGLFYFLRDGDKIKKALIKLSPLSDQSDIKILEKLKITINSVIRGSLLLAVINGLLIAISLIIFNVPNAAFWGTIVTVTALIPGIGIALVVIPCALFLVLMGQGLSAFGLVAWGLISSFAVDNFLGPKIMAKGTEIHPLIILFSVLGGIAFFGPMGFLLGPVVLSFLFALLKIYPEAI